MLTLYFFLYALLPHMAGSGFPLSVITSISPDRDWSLTYLFGRFGMKFKL